jgi:hypothetical protein
MAQRSDEIRGVFRYSANDIRPDSIVIEVITRGHGCSFIPISWTTIYVCKDILNVARTCKNVLLDLIECGLIDPDVWQENWECEEGTPLSVNRRLALMVNQAKIQEVNAPHGRIESRARVIVETFNIFDDIDDVRVMKDWIKQKEIQAWLSRFLDSDDEEEESTNRTLPKSLLIPGHQKLIAEAINSINRKTPWT